MNTKTKTPSKPKAEKAPKPVTPTSPVTSGVSVYTAFRCPVTLRDLVKAAAAKENRSLSNYIVAKLTASVGA